MPFQVACIFGNPSGGRDFSLWLHTSVNFNTGAESCKHHHNQGTKQFTTPKPPPPPPRVATPSQYLSPLVTANLSWVTTVCLSAKGRNQEHVTLETASSRPAPRLQRSSARSVLSHCRVAVRRSCGPVACRRPSLPVGGDCECGFYKRLCAGLLVDTNFLCSGGKHLREASLSYVKCMFTFSRNFQTVFPCAGAVVPSPQPGRKVPGAPRPRRLPLAVLWGQPPQQLSPQGSRRGGDAAKAGSNPRARKTSRAAVMS